MGNLAERCVGPRRGRSPAEIAEALRSRREAIQKAIRIAESEVEALIEEGKSIPAKDPLRHEKRKRIAGAIVRKKEAVRAKQEELDQVESMIASQDAVSHQRFMLDFAWTQTIAARPLTSPQSMRRVDAYVETMDDIRDTSDALNQALAPPPTTDFEDAVDAEYNALFEDEAEATPAAEEDARATPLRRRGERSPAPAGGSVRETEFPSVPMGRPAPRYTDDDDFGAPQASGKGVTVQEHAGRSGSARDRVLIPV